MRDTFCLWHAETNLKDICLIYLWRKWFIFIMYSWIVVLMYCCDVSLFYSYAECNWCQVYIQWTLRALYLRYNVLNWSYSCVQLCMPLSGRWLQLTKRCLCVKLASMLEISGCMNNLTRINYSTIWKRLLPYAEIGASFQQSPFWSIVVGGLLLLFTFEFGRT